MFLLQGQEKLFYQNSYLKERIQEKQQEDFGHPSEVHCKLSLHLQLERESDNTHQEISYRKIVSLNKPPYFDSRSNGHRVKDSLDLLLHKLNHTVQDHRNRKSKSLIPFYKNSP